MNKVNLITVTVTPKNSFRPEFRKFVQDVKEQYLGSDIDEVNFITADKKQNPEINGLPTISALEEFVGGRESIIILDKKSLPSLAPEIQKVLAAKARIITY